MTQNNRINREKDLPPIMSCPDCGDPLPIYQNYSPWCDQCDWNLQPLPPRAPLGRVATLYRRAGRLLDTRLFEKAVEAQPRPRRVTPEQIVALTFSALVYITIGFILYSLLSLVALTPWIALKITGAITFLLVLWIIFPRFDIAPPETVMTREDDFPEINQLVETISSALGVEKPNVMMTEQFTATFGRVGHRRKPLLCLGHPFISILNQEELVSLLAHELSHSRDGAVTRGLFVRVALTALDRIHYVFTPWRRYGRYSGNTRVALMFLSAPLRPIAWLLRSYIFILEVCCYRDSQRAEYVADLASIPVAGSRNAVSLLRKSYYRHLDALRFAYDAAPPFQKYLRLKQQLTMIPERELERVWRIAQRQNATLHSTHPSVHRRVRFFNSWRDVAPQIHIEEAQFSMLQRELEAWPRVIRQREESIFATEAIISESMSSKERFSPAPAD